MKHVQKFQELNEAAKSGNAMGYLAYFSGSWWMGSFLSFPAFASRFYVEFAGIEYEEDRGDSPIIDFPMLHHLVYDAMEDQYGHSETLENEMETFTVWCGLNTKLEPGTLTSHSGSDGNPYKAIESLERCFTGLKAQMLKKPLGNTVDVQYIAQSIENDFSYVFSYYIDHFTTNHPEFDPDFTLEEVIKAIKRPDALVGYFKENPLEMDLLDCNPKLKADVIKLAGLEDVSDLARAMRKGLI